MKIFTKHLISAVLILTLAFAFTGCSHSPAKDTSSGQSSGPSMENSSQKQDSEPLPSADPPAEPIAPKEPEILPEPANMDDALFIGDSRVTGLMEYSGLSSDFFTFEGMSVYNIHDKPLSVPNVGKVTLNELLSNKSYGKIYLMLGINELGYKLDQTIAIYGDLVDLIHQAQPDAALFIMANLHVTESMSSSHAYITNSAINAFNQRISQFANGETIFYLDVNPEFDTANGNLSDEYTSDGAHPYAKHYIHWGDWIARQTASLLKEG